MLAVAATIWANAGVMSETTFPAFEHISGAPDAGVLFLCDHASNALPPEYGDLGLGPEQLRRHIAYDIGAARITRRWAARFGAPAALSTFSRLLIDPNRGADDPTLVMKMSDGAVVPGNVQADQREIAARLALYWRPYRERVRAQIEAMAATGRPPAIVSVHSFTPVWKGRARPWHIGVLWDADPRLPAPFIAALRRDPALVVGDNEPYDGALEGDVIDEMATRLGLANVLIEFRQDLVGSDLDADAWADRIEPALREALAAPDVNLMRQHGSRTRQRGAPAQPR